MGSLNEPYFQETVPYCRVAVGGDPDAGEVVGVDAVLYELSASVLVHVDAAGLPMVDLTLHNGWVRSGFHLKPRDPVVVDVVRFKVTLQNVLEIMYQLSLAVTLFCGHIPKRRGGY